MIQAKKVVTRGRNGIVTAIGQVDVKTGKPVGHWEYFTDEGNPLKSGDYDLNGRVGIWMQYNWQTGDAYNVTFKRDRPQNKKFVGKIVNLLKIESITHLNIVLDHTRLCLVG